MAMLEPLEDNGIPFVGDIKENMLVFGQQPSFGFHIPKTGKKAGKEIAHYRIKKHRRTALCLFFGMERIGKNYVLKTAPINPPCPSSIAVGYGYVQMRKN